MKIRLKDKTLYILNSSFRCRLPVRCKYSFHNNYLIK
jgi:hypothetical protein